MKTTTGVVTSNKDSWFGFVLKSNCELITKYTYA